MRPTDEELILDYQAGNVSALEEVFHRYKKPVLNFSLRILANRADAEDVVGDVFVALSSQKYTQRPGIKFSTWLFKIARNCSISKIRKRKKLTFMWFKDKKTDQDCAWDIPDNEDSSSEVLIKKEKADYVQQAIQTLPIQQKEAIILREYHALSYDQIAEIMECSLDNVKILIFRAREQLKKKLRSLIKEDE
ncbi:MAG: sigma-70 family RNA polymerase sigma factor [Candidatus Omnitrophota bacterium]